MAVGVRTLLYRGILPFLAVYIVALLLITYIPIISLALLALLKC